MSALLHLLGGGLLLYFGAQWLVAGSSALALALRIPQLIVGLTVVAYGTSTPEIIVSVQAALAGHPAVAIGNVVGSNIANIGLILGLAALIAPARRTVPSSRANYPYCSWPLLWYLLRSSTARSAESRPQRYSPAVFSTPAG